jgi:hypothetical protein
MNISDDKRWQRFNDQAYMGTHGGGQLAGIFHLSFAAPQIWPGIPKESPIAALDTPGDVLTSDFCRVGEDLMVRTMLPITLQDTKEHVLISVWAKVGPEDFAALRESFDAGTQGELPEMYAQLMNSVPHGAPLYKSGAIEPHDGGRKPLFWIEDETHPWFETQQKGVDFDGLLDIYEMFGHNLRPQLGEA